MFDFCDLTAAGSHFRNLKLEQQQVKFDIKALGFSKSCLFMLLAPQQMHQESSISWKDNRVFRLEAE